MQRLGWDQKRGIFKLLNLEFTTAQLPFVMDSTRFPVVIGGERGGKSYASAVEMVPHILALPKIKPEKFRKPGGKPVNPMKERLRKPHFVLFGPHYSEPHWEFEYIEEQLDKLGYLIKTGPNAPSKPQDGPWRLVTTAGVVVTTWSLAEPKDVRALDLEGALVCEAGNCLWDGVERIQGRVSGTRGFIIYSGTLENSQKWYRDHALTGKRENRRQIKTFSLPTWTNHHQFPGGRQDPEIIRLEEEYDEDLFAMRVAAEPRPPRDRVIPEAKWDHIREMKIPEGARYEIWIDPGYAEAHAVLFVAHWTVQSKRGQRRVFYVFDELYIQRTHTRDIAEMVRAHPSFPLIVMTNEKFRVGGVIDIAGKGHRDSTDSALEIWEEETGLFFEMGYWHEDVLMERVRSSFRQGRIAISPKCEGLIAELGLGDPVFPNMSYWRYRTDRTAQVKGEKAIDAWNHSSKALGYGILFHIGPVERAQESTSVSRLARQRPAATYLKPAPRRKRRR